MTFSEWITLCVQWRFHIWRAPSIDLITFYQALIKMNNFYFVFRSPPNSLSISFSSIRFTIHGKGSFAYPIRTSNSNSPSLKPLQVMRYIIFSLCSQGGDGRETEGKNNFHSILVDNYLSHPVYWILYLTKDCLDLADRVAREGYRTRAVSGFIIASSIGS